jgi:polyphenol oxidase
MPRAAHKRTPQNRPLGRGSGLSPAPRDAGWQTRRSAGIATLHAEILQAIPWLVHGFSTRSGGQSRLDGARVLNLGFTEWDSRKAVSANRGKLLRALGAERMLQLTLRQIHSDVVYLAATPPAAAPAGDASVTQLPGLLLGVQTADCAPILLADTKRRVVAAVHAGWRGTLARVVVKTLGRMRLEFGTRPADVTAALGPAIGRCCYDVGPEVALAFSGQFAEATEWFDGPFDRLATGEEPNPLPWLTMMPPGHQPPPERVQLDLRAANRWQLVDAGVPARRIAVSTLCTACRGDLLFSYRREGVGTGRLMAVIGMRPAARYAGGGAGAIPALVAGVSMSASCPQAAPMSRPRE